MAPRSPFDNSSYNPLRILAASTNRRPPKRLPLLGMPSSVTGALHRHRLLRPLKKYGRHT
eukprot:1189793-Prorocentrum_minimum.AAC.1